MTETRASAATAAARRPRGRPGPRRTRFVLLAAALVVAAWGAVVFVELRAAQATMLEAREQLFIGRDRVAEGDLVGARAAFRSAAASFADAEAVLFGPAVRLASIPGPGNSVRVAQGLAVAGGDAAAAASEVAGAIADLPGGQQALAPRDGRLPVDTLRRLAPVFERADAAIEDAVARVDALPRRFLAPPVAEALEASEHAMDGGAEAVDTAHALVSALPDFFGGDEPRRYLLAASNPAELRGTGGFLGAYTIVTFDDGRLSMEEFAEIQDLPDLPVTAVEPPNPSYAERYDRYGGAGFWMNVNMTPDFPSAAEAMVNLYEAVRGERLDGVVVADPRMLAALLTVSGPTDLPGVGRVDADTVVDYVTNEAYGDISDPELRKQVLGTVAAQALRALLSGDAAGGPAELVSTFTAEVGRGHLLVYSTHREEQRAFQQAGVAGQLPEVDHDFLGVFVNNAAANKADYYAKRTVAYEVALSADGSSDAVARITLANDAPEQGPPAHVIGPNVPGLDAGDNLSIVSVYARHDAELTAASRTADDAPLVVERELGRPVFTTTARIPSASSVGIDMAWRSPSGWEVVPAPSGEEGRYAFTYAPQPTLLPTTVRLSFQVPPGTEVSGHSEGLVVEGDRVVYTGAPEVVTTWEVRFTPAPATSWTGRIKDLLSRPLW